MPITITGEEIRRAVILVMHYIKIKTSTRPSVSFGMKTIQENGYKKIHALEIKT